MKSYIIENEALRICVNESGAQLSSIFDIRDRRECLWQGDASIWAWRSPILFPVIGEVKEDTYVYHDRRYTMRKHGFARDFEHLLMDSSETELTFRLASNAETRGMYPFDFELRTAYRLREASLTVSHTVRNDSRDTMPFSIGFHTAFNCPFDCTHTAEQYVLQFEKKETTDKFLRGPGLTGETIPFLENEDRIQLKDGLFAQGSIILNGLRSSQVDIAEEESGRRIRLSFHGFPYVAVWSVPEKLYFICIEPWHGLPDFETTDGMLMNKPGIVLLPPSAQFECSQTITVMNGSALDS